MDRIYKIYRIDFLPPQSCKSCKSCPFSSFQGVAHCDLNDASEKVAQAGLGAPPILACRVPGNDRLTEASRQGWAALPGPLALVIPALS
jgi:hypothetical protein